MNLITIFNQFPDQQSCIAHLRGYPLARESILPALR